MNGNVVLPSGEKIVWSIYQEFGQDGWDVRIDRVIPEPNYQYFYESVAVQVPLDEAFVQLIAMVSKHIVALTEFKRKLQRVKGNTLDKVESFDDLVRIFANDYQLGEFRKSGQFGRIVIEDIILMPAKELLWIYSGSVVSAKIEFKGMTVSTLAHKIEAVVNDLCYALIRLLHSITTAYEDVKDKNIIL